MSLLPLVPKYIYQNIYFPHYFSILSLISSIIISPLNIYAVASCIVSWMVCLLSKVYSSHNSKVIFQKTLMWEFFEVKCVHTMRVTDCKSIIQWVLKYIYFIYYQNWDIKHCLPSRNFSCALFQSPALRGNHYFDFFHTNLLCLCLNIM
jgi:hypothetical protein